MDLSPHEIRTASFATSRKGLDPDQVATFLRRAAEALESAQNQAAAMEAKARGAVAKLQELSAAGASTAASAAGTAPPDSLTPDRADEISRTLLLAQRAADETTAAATAESERLLESARERSARMIDEARAEARAAGADEHEQVRSEVDELLARRDFLTADVDHLESFLVDQRARLREVAATLIDLAERVPGGIGQVRAPLVSAVEETPASDAPIVVDGSTGGDSGDHDADLRDDEPGADDPDSDADADDAATQAMPLIRPLDVDNADPTPPGDPEQLRFRPDTAGRGDPTAR